MHPLPSGVPAPRPTVAPPTRPGYTIRETRVEDLVVTSRLYVRYLPIGLFPRLGERFVARWERAFLDSPHAVALTVTGTDPAGRERVDGFLLGATDRLRFRQDVLADHRAALLGRGTLALITRPRILTRFLRTRSGPYLRGLFRAPARHGDRTGPGTDGGETVADLTAIVISPQLRRTGAGKELVATFLRRCAAAGTPTAELVTAIEPADAMNFYLRTGWTTQQQYVTRDGLRVQCFARSTGPTGS